MTNGKPASATLLPPAGVDLFAHDADTISAFEKLGDDWRFARVTLEAVEGGIETAISKYESVASPSLVVIEAETVDDDFLGHLEDLAGNCEQGTAAIVIGPTNDVQLYRKLVGMGVSDYLVRPVKTEDLLDVIAESLINRMGVTESRLVAVTGSKGGVGTTSIAQILAHNFSEDLGQKTIIIDASGSWGSNNIDFDLDPVAPLREAVRAAQKGDDDNLRRMIQQVDDKLYILATGGDPLLGHHVEADGFEQLLDHFLAEFPVVVVDLSKANIGVLHRTLTKAQSIIMVTTPLLPALRNTRSIIAELKELRDGDIPVSLVVNMQRIAHGQEVAKSDIEAALDLEPDAIVPFDPKLFVGCQAAGKPLSSTSGGRKIANLMLEIASKISGGGKGGDKEQGGQSEKGGISSLLGMLGGGKSDSVASKG